MASTPDTNRRNKDGIRHAHRRARSTARISFKVSGKAVIDLSIRRDCRPRKSVGIAFNVALTVTLQCAVIVLKEDAAQLFGLPSISGNSPAFCAFGWALARLGQFDRQFLGRFRAHLRQDLRHACATSAWSPPRPNPHVEAVENARGLLRLHAFIHGDDAFEALRLGFLAHAAGRLDASPRFP